MAFLCSGYWALLFCFASVQIGARGAALMQTTVESAKLRMEQIAELAKKPTVHKSKQHLEKITKDVKALAAQALIAKNQSANITAGGITDNLTIAALNTMNDSAQLIVDQAVNETKALREFLTLALNDAQTCDVQVGPFPTSYESDHNDCRAELLDLFLAASASYEDAVKQARTTSGCLTKFVSNCSAWDAEFFDLSNFSSLESCLNQIDSWAKNGTDNISSKSTPSSEFLAEQLACDALQQKYEHAFCIHRLSKVRQCQENHRCYESNKATYDQQAALVNSTNDARRAAYAAGKKIQCLVDKLLTNLSETAIASCENAQVDTTSLQIQTQTLPTDPGFSCPLTVEALDEQNEPWPCNSQWMSDYEGQDWYNNTLYSVYPLRCMSSCSVEPVPSFWMEAERATDSRGSLTWPTTSEPVYRFSPLGVSPALDTDDGSCRKTVEFPGDGGFFQLGNPDPVYRPNIEDYLELWVVFDGDVVDGEDQAYILDSGNFPSNGLGFLYYNESRVAAYAPNQLAVADRPAAATSGLNVWRVQWKNSSYIAISFNNELLVNKTVNVSLTVNYTTLPGSYTRLGMRSEGTGDSFLQGRIAELQLFDRELTDYEANVTNLGFMTKYAVGGTKGGDCP